ncbi:MAG: gliding motility-associated C-terminal domain-containing protein [Saprospiraceae bacterium]
METPPFCVGNSTTLSVSGGSFKTYLWSTGDSTKTIIAISPGAYAVTVTSDTLCPAVDTSILTLLIPPNAAIEAPPPLDCINNLVVLDASNSDDSTYIGINWTTIGGNIIGGQGTLMLSVNAPGNYILQLYDSTTTCSAYDTVTVTSIQAFPPATAGPDEMVNCAITSINIGPASDPGIPNLTYTWTTPNGNIVAGQSSWAAEVDAPGIYIVAVTNTTNNCMSFDTVVVSQDINPPTPLIATPDSITCIVNSVVLDGSGSTGNNLSFSWSTVTGSILAGANSSKATVSQAGTYSLLITDQSNGCTATASIEVIQDAQIPLANAALPDTLNCLVTQLNLNGAGSTTGNNISYNWTTANGNIVSGATTLTPTVNQPGNYLLTVENNSNNCTSTFNVIVPQNIQAPVANAGPTFTLNCTVTSLQLNGSNSSAGAFMTYLWSTANGNIVSGAATTTPTINQAGTYALLVTNTNNGCTATATATALKDVAVPIVSIAAPVQLDCISSSVVLDGSNSSQGMPFQLSWSGPQGGIVAGASTPQPTVNLPGTYMLTISNLQNGCVDSMAVQVVQDIAPPNPNAGPDDLVNCYAPSIAIGSANNPSGPNFTLLWTTTGGNIVSGASSNTPTVNEAGTYTLLITNTANGCTATDEAIVTEDFLQPTANAGPTLMLNCTSPGLQLNGGNSSAGAFMTYLWSTANGHIVSGAATTTPTVDQAGTYSLLVTNTNNGCTATATATVLKDVAAPIVSIAAPALLNCISTSVVLDGSNSSQGPSFQLSWSDPQGGIVAGASTPQPTVNLPGTYTLIISNLQNGCVDSMAVQVVRDIVPPLPDAGPDDVVNCYAPAIAIGSSNNPSGSNITLLWTTTGGNIVSGTNSNTPTVDQAGTYTLLITNTVNGCTATDQAIVTEDFLQPTANAGPGFQLDCQQTSYVLQAAAGQGTNLAYQWTTSNGNIVSGASTLTPTVNAAGIYQLLVTNQDNGCTNTASVSVTQNAVVPAASASSPQTLTCAITQVQLNGQGSSIGTGITYNWTTANGTIVGGTTTLNPLVSAPGTYTLQVFDTNNHCSTIANVVVNQNIEQPVIDAGPDATLTCTVLNLPLQAKVLSSSSNMLQYSWSTPNGTILSGASTSTPIIGSPGTYALLVTDQSNGCTATDQLTVANDVAVPIAQIAPAQTLTCSLTNIPLNGTTSSTGANFTFLWSTLNGNFVGQPNSLQPTVDAPGTYTLLITNTVNGCTKTASVVVLEDVALPIAVAGPTAVLTCSNPTQALNATGTSVGSNVQYLWTTANGKIDNGHTSLMPTVSLPGTYVLLVTNNSTGCTATSTVQISADMQLPVLTSAPPGLITCIVKNVPLQATATNAGNAPLYQWNTQNGNIVSGQSTLSPTVNSAGAYTLLVTNTTNGCTRSITVTVQADVTPPSVTISNPGLLTCSVAQLALNASPSAGTSLQWTTPNGNILSGSTSASPVVNAPGTYNLLVTTTTNGCTTSGSVQVLEEQNIPTDFDFVLTPPNCLGKLGIVNFGTVQGGIGPYLYSVDGGQHFQSPASFINLKPGNYTLVIQDVNGCEVETPLNVPEPPKPGVDLTPSFTIQLGENQLLEPILPASFPIGTIDSVVWNPLTDLSFSGTSIQEQLTPTASPLKHTKYTLTLYTAEGCSASASTQIWVKTNLDIYAPNVIKPDDPQNPENAYFTVYTTKLGVDKIIQLQVYDRWGTHIWTKQNFQPNDPTEGWDGTYKGEALNPGVFVWWGEVLLVNGQKILLQGDVTIVR